MIRFVTAGAAVVLAAGVLLGSCCCPKARVHGVGNAGGLIFAVDPPDAEVLLDGVARGKASGFTEDRPLRVENGTHRLELGKPGYETYARDVYVPGTLLLIEAALTLGGSPPGGYREPAAEPR